MKRSGFSLIEIVLAVGLAGGALLITAGLIRANVASSRVNVERAAAGMALADLVEILRAQPPEQLRALRGSGPVEDLLAVRVGRLPDAIRAQVELALRSLAGKLSFCLQEDVDGVPGLVGIALAAQLERGDTVRASRLFRGAR